MTSRRGIFLLLSAWLFLFTVQPVAAVDHRVSAVTDRSGVMSQEVQNEITNYAWALQEKTGAEFAVLIQDTIDLPIEEFSQQQFQQMKLGKNNNGLLLVVTMKPDVSGKRYFRLHVGYELEGALPDGKVGRMIDEIAMPYLENEQPTEAIVEFYKAIYNEVMIEYGLDGEQMLVSTLNDGNYSSDDEDLPVPVVIIIFIVILIIAFSSGSSGPPSRGGRRRGGMYRTTSFGGSSGGFGGRSGGSSGGFGGFGGGGSSGGGGAGRSW